jgi:DNA-binding MarR family transcriptional regulator
MMRPVNANPERDLVTASGLLFEAAMYTQRRVFDDVERVTGLPGIWLEILLRLQRTPGGAVRISEVAEQVSFAPSSLSRLADKMEEDGLVERIPDPSHRRATLLRLTADGEQRLDDAEQVRQAALQTRFADLLSDGELDMLEVIARKLRAANRPDRPARRTRPAREVGWVRRAT